LTIEEQQQEGVGVTSSIGVRRLTFVIQSAVEEQEPVWYTISRLRFENPLTLSPDFDPGS
jgi:hypothetical protein